MNFSRLIVPALVTFLGLSATSVGFAGDQWHCTSGTLKGTFGFYRTGNTPVGPLAAVGTINFDGKGNFTATQSISRNGSYSYDVAFSGTYTIARDCAGVSFLNGVEFARLVVTDGGHGFYIFSESAGNSVYGVGRMIDPS